ncbi:hypothetical protein GCM10009727_66850 [Actinomadura napierensis]|uniref:Recombinase domain-containing protein n=1 Tax=Actinomadura napierensis TaxID=267854 RepID=A0ABP5M4G2_9ACTN
MARGRGRQAPYGYRRIRDARGRYVTQLPMEPQAGVVREIISRVAQGQAIPQIIRELEGRGVPAPRGGPRWSRSVVTDIVHNPAYIGKPKVDADERVAWAPLVPEQLFFTAQRALQGPGGSSAGYPAFGLLLCALGPCHGVFASCLQAVS